MEIQKINYNNTDYVLIKQDKYEQALKILSGAGYKVI